MTKYPQFDVEKCKSLKLQLNSAFNNIKGWEGSGLDELEYHLGNMTYSDNQVTLKLTVRIKGAPDKMMEDLQEFIRVQKKCNGNEYKLTVGNLELIGYKPKNRKYPFIYLDHSCKKSFKISWESMDKKFLIKQGPASEFLKPLDDIFPQGINDAMGG
jgi:hypothetical protein